MGWILAATIGAILLGLFTLVWFSILRTFTKAASMRASDSSEITLLAAELGDLEAKHPSHTE